VALPGVREEIVQKSEKICQKLAALGTIDLKRGALKSLVAEIQEVQRETDQDWHEKAYLTRLLLSLANISRVVLQFELLGVHGPPTPSRRASPVNPFPGTPLQSYSPSFKDFDAASIVTSDSTLSIAGSDETNLFVETDLDGVIENAVSPVANRGKLELNSLMGLNIKELLATASDQDAYAESVRFLFENPSDITEIKCCLLIGEAVVVDGKGMLVCEQNTDQPTRVIWVFRLSSDGEEDLEDLTDDQLLCQICNLYIPQSLFEAHSVRCGDLLQSENAATVAQEKLRETKQQVIEFPTHNSTHFVISRFLNRIDKAILLHPGSLSPDEVSIGRLKSAILVWSKSFPK